MFYCSRGQINVQVPWGIAGAGTAVVKVVVNESEGNALTLPVAAADPGIFVVNSATQTGAVIFQDGQWVTAGRPATTGDVLSLYATGLGMVNPVPPTDGTPASGDPLQQTMETPIVTIDGVESPVSFSGLTPGLVGLHQVNFAIPDGVAAGIHDLVISVGGKSSNTVKIITQ